MNARNNKRSSFVAVIARYYQILNNDFAENRTMAGAEYIYCKIIIEHLKKKKMKRDVTIPLFVDFLRPVRFHNVRRQECVYRLAYIFVHRWRRCEL